MRPRSREAVSVLVFQMGASAWRETVGEDLIEDLIGHPGRMTLRPFETKLAQPLDGHRADPFRAKPAVVAGPEQLEAIGLPGGALVQGQRGLVVAIAGHLALGGHGDQPLFIIGLAAQQYLLWPMVGA